MADESNASSDPQTSRGTANQREGVLSWDECFMAIAFVAGKRSKHPVTQVGACIVNQDKRIVGTGYNGMPNGCSDDDFQWSKSIKSLYACHAEMNAIVNKNSADVKNCTIYVSLFPCNECAKIIIQSGIKEVVYMSDKHAEETKKEAAEKMFEAAGVSCRKYEGDSKIEFDFTEIDWDSQN